MNAYLKWDLGVATWTGYDDDGFIGVQIDAFGEGRSGMPPFEAIHPYGFASRPEDPSEDGTGCATLYFYKGDQARALFCHDPRPIGLLPVIAKGESFQYGAFGNFVRCHRNGVVSIFTHDGTLEDGKSGQSVFAQVRPDGFRFAGPWGKLTFDATGLHCVHSSGAHLDLGAIGGMPAPLDSLGSYAKLQAAMVTLEASILALGTSTASEPAAKATSLLTMLSAMQAAITALGASVVANNAAIQTTAATAPLKAAAATAATAATTAVTASSTAVTAGALSVPSNSTSVS